MPWVEHQFLKQSPVNIQRSFEQEFELVILDSSREPWKSDIARVFHVPGQPGISWKREVALSAARGNFVTWFDDDDWQSPEKLQKVRSLSGGADAVGTRHAYMYSTVSGQAALYESTYEPIIFNSAVYRKNSVPQNFDPTRITAEDTEWHERWLKTRPSYVTLGEPMHAWLCHEKNVTNRANSRFFELPNPIPFDDWEREFFERLRVGR